MFKIVFAIWSGRVLDHHSLVNRLSRVGKICKRRCRGWKTGFKKRAQFDLPLLLSTDTTRSIQPRLLEVTKRNDHYSLRDIAVVLILRVIGTLSRVHNAIITLSATSDLHSANPHVAPSLLDHFNPISVGRFGTA